MLEQLTHPSHTRILFILQSNGYIIYSRLHKKEARREGNKKTRKILRWPAQAQFKGIQAGLLILLHAPINMMQAIPIHTYVQGTTPCETTDTSHGRNKNVSLTRTHAPSSELTKLEGNLMLARTDDNIKKNVRKTTKPKNKA